MKNRTVLIIDDNPNDLSLMTQTLEESGYQIITADNSVDGVNLFLNHDPAIAIIDLYFRGKEEGVDIIRQIKRINPEATLILVTANASMSSAIATLRLGIFDYIQKPFELNDLVWRVERGMQIVEQRNQLTAANERVKKLSTAIDHSFGPVIMTDKNGKIEYANPAFCESSGYLEEEIIGNTPRFLKSGKHSKEFYGDLWNTILSGDVWEGEICNKKKNGDYFWVRQSITPLRNENGDITQFVGVRLDVTQKKEDEDNLLKYANELERVNKELELLSTTDALTGIANRRAFEQFLEREWKLGMRNKQPIAAIMIDIDCFKPYNDLYGHQVGDACLKKVAQSLQASLKRPGDMVARYGGEEFVIIVSDSPEKGVAGLAEKVRMSVEALNIPHEGSKVKGVVTVSLGIAQMVPDRNSLSSSLIAEADKSLYRAKQKGRNIVEVSNAIG